jgi:hypothetical protein
VVQVVIAEEAGEVIEFGHRGPRPRGIAHRDGPVQAGDRGGRQVQQHAVQQHDLIPVGVLSAPGPGAVDAGDRRRPANPLG